MDRIIKKREVTPSAALTKLTRLCSLSEKSSADCIKLLQRWEIPQIEIPNIIETLISEKYIDDKRYLKLYIKEKMNYNGWGTRKIGATLIAKGIAPALVRDAIAQADTNAETTKLEQIITRKFNSLKDKEEDKYKLKDKLFRFAAGRGYDFEQILSILDKLL